MTFAPSRVKTRAMPSPMPVVEPVMRITLSFRRTKLRSWKKHSFNDDPGMHLLKSSVPVAERRHTIENRIEIDLACGQQGNDLLPNGPIVRETALKCCGLLY